jgi:hypothetical protein
VNRNKLFGPKLKPRSDRLIAIDVALKDNYQPHGNAEQTRGFLLLVNREPRNWLRNMRSKADAGNLGTTARVQAAGDPATWPARTSPARASCSRMRTAR